MDTSPQDIAGGLGALAVLIPAWQPEDRLVGLIESLSAAGFGALIVVDDGSSSESQHLFQSIAALPGVHLLRHAVNLGKGRALKTGMNYVLAELPQIQDVVTADADGQHTATDIVRVAKASAGNGVVLGTRAFAKDVPLRSRLGNLLTRRIFGFVTGTWLTDTQTGLRALPRSVLPELMTLEGERYEYEMTVLVHLCRNGHRPVEVFIETVYIEGNRTSHFDPIWDSMRIYFVLVRFYFSSIVAAIIDFAGFAAAFALTGNILVSLAVGRLSSLVNFALNKKFVFHNRASITGTLWKYYVLVAAIGGLSYGSIWTLAHFLHWNVFAAKVTVDVLLSLVSFSAQRTFVFRRPEPI
jgi:glycosyltransferase involved in cell wall biosynthesis